MRKLIPYAAIFVIGLVIVLFCDHKKPQLPTVHENTRKYDSLTAVIGRIVYQHTLDTIGNRVRLMSKDSVIRVWRSRAQKQLVKTVVVKVRQEVPEVDSVLTAYTTLDSVQRYEIDSLRLQLRDADRYAFGLYNALQQRDTTSQGTIQGLHSRVDSLTTQNRRLVKNNRRLWLGNGVQAALHALRSLD